MYLSRLFFLLILTFFGISSASAEQCVEADQATADYWENYYTPEGAYAFGEQIRHLVAENDLPGLFALVNGELKNGPKTNDIADKSFEQVFNDDWVNLVLSEPSPCSPVGYRGFMLGHGMIWYTKSEDGWAVIAINGAIKSR